MIPDTRISAAVVCALLASASLATAQTPDPGRQTFVARCAGCHGTDGNGGELGPAISMRVPARTDEELTTLLKMGLPSAGMPAFANLSDADVRDLIRFLRTLQPREGSRPAALKVTLANGAPLEGLVLNQGNADLQLLGNDRKIHLLRPRSASFCREQFRVGGGEALHQRSLADLYIAKNFIAIRAKE